MPVGRRSDLVRGVGAPALTALRVAVGSSCPCTPALRPRGFTHQDTPGGRLRARSRALTLGAVFSGLVPAGPAGTRRRVLRCLRPCSGRTGRGEWSPPQSRQSQCVVLVGGPRCPGPAHGVQEEPPSPSGAGPGGGPCAVCRGPETRGDSGVVICPHAVACVRARSGAWKIPAPISELSVLGRDALTECSEPGAARAPAARCPPGARPVRAGPRPSAPESLCPPSRPLS